MPKNGKRGRPAAEPEDSEDEDAVKIETVYPLIKLLSGAWEALQQQFDDGAFSGDVQKQQKCEFEFTKNGKPYQCAHVVAVEKKITEECTLCHHKHKERIAGYCIGHAINVFGGNAPAKLQTEMDLA